MCYSVAQKKNSIGFLKNRFLGVSKQVRVANRKREEGRKEDERVQAIILKDASFILFQMKQFNERKTEILKLLEDGSELAASDVAQELGINPVNASRLLGHYFRQGLLRRRTADKFGIKSYQITRRGRNRLNWIREKL